MPFRIVPFSDAHVDTAAEVFVDAFADLRRRVTALPDHLARVDVVASRLRGMNGVAALDGGRLVGFLSAWYPIAGFRGTSRAGAYVPEWGHGAIGPNRPAVYRALYREASAGWARAGCSVHAITTLADDPEALETWFWSGFGMGTVDGIREMEPLSHPGSWTGGIRRATVEDASALARLDEAHQRHYADPPVFMVPRVPDDEAAWTRFLAQPRCSAWLAERDGTAVGFLRLDRTYSASAAIESPSGAFISGAYVVPEHRRAGAMTAMLDAALRHHAAEGLTSCGVDFEAFNPEAATFWPRHFATVCLSMMRVPESA
jgi:GNAT superfamily N-acetyltransferase